MSDEIHGVFPFVFKNNAKITFESLANHTSGLPRLPSNFVSSNTNNPYKNYGKNALEVYLKNGLILENEVERRYTYSNLGMGLPEFK